MSWIKNTLTLLLSCLFTLLLVEAALRFFPVMEVSRVKPLSSSAKALEVSTATNTELVNSYGWDFKNPVHRKTNNYGFFSDFNYEEGHAGVFVIGDSFVEARQVSFEQTFHQIMAGLIDAPVYNIGIGGAPLSQYHAYTNDVCEQFKPTSLIFPIIANDFDESLFEQRARAGFFHYHKDDTLKPTPYEITAIRKWANHSSLIKYLYFNLSLGAILSTDEKPALDVKQADGEDYKDLTDLFLTNLSQVCVPPSNITFVVDANRYELPGVPMGNTIYDQSPAQLGRFKYFKAAANNANFNVIDLQDVMIQEYGLNGVKFEFPFDYHWNIEGHALVAKTILQTFSADAL